MDQAQAERVAGNILFVDRTFSQIRILQRSAKKGCYATLYEQSINWFSGPSDAEFQTNYNACRSAIVNRLVSMDVIQGGRSPHVRWKAA